MIHHSSKALSNLHRSFSHDFGFFPLIWHVSSVSPIHSSAASLQLSEEAVVDSICRMSVPLGNRRRLGTVYLIDFESYFWYFVKIDTMDQKLLCVLVIVL